MRIKLNKYVPNTWFRLSDNVYAYVTNSHISNISIDIESIEYMDNSLCTISILSVSAQQVGFIIHVKRGTVDLLDKNLTIYSNCNVETFPHIEEQYYGDLKLIIADNNSIIITISHNKSEKYLHS